LGSALTLQLLEVGERQLQRQLSLQSCSSYSPTSVPRALTSYFANQVENQSSPKNAEVCRTSTAVHPKKKILFMLKKCVDFWRTHSQLQYETEMEQRRQNTTPQGEAEPEDRWPREELYQEQLKRSSWFQQMVNLFKLPYSRRACVT
jgi:hypothetical protein